MALLFLLFFAGSRLILPLPFVFVFPFSLFFQFSHPKITQFSFHFLGKITIFFPSDIPNLCNILSVNLNSFCLHENNPTKMVNFDFNAIRFFLFDDLSSSQEMHGEMRKKTPWKKFHYFLVF